MSVQTASDVDVGEWTDFEALVSKPVSRALDDVVVELKTDGRTDLDGWEAYEAVVREGLRHTGFLGVADGRVHPETAGEWVVEETIQRGDLPANDTEYETRPFIVRRGKGEVLRGMSVACGRPDRPDEAEVFTAFVELGLDELFTRASPE